ncbi:early nodulin-93-like [Diospyros lotus]|uniref:early nodulin-93-like n=1 Tax=Diospyros lotus TaxID=55363 RepID=UPI0022520C8D|nr:early nodulin-93-like [Diospyros lotus]
MGLSAQHGRVTAENCTQESVRQGLKSAVMTAVIVAVPTLVAVRTIPWAKANINHTGQALIISGASVAAYFITADKTILKAATKNASYDRTA